jgi:ectoine hydroxylase-related dioxygenase (phytanoyl-CoA dioxygenase family)
MILRIAPKDSERTAGTLRGETIEQAARGFRIDGALIIEDIVDRAIIAEARTAFVKAYSNYLDGEEHEDALRVGGRRLMVSVKLEPPFDDPQLFANPHLLSVLSSELDDSLVLGAFGVVCSLPSAPTQHRHYDGGILFPHTGFDRLLPATAITVGIPLLEMNELHGTTALWLGSHRDPDRISKDKAIEPVVSEGSCMLWDFRLYHGGTPNRSAEPRPLLYLTYCRPWFFDHLNFNKKGNRKQKPLLARKNFLSGLSEGHQRLLARAWEA